MPREARLQLHCKLSNCASLMAAVIAVAAAPASNPTLPPHPVIVLMVSAFLLGAW
jgi:hypothetical protein